ncbi:MAG: NUDIX hydrolase [Candidatus Nanosalina sp.]
MSYESPHVGAMGVLEHGDGLVYVREGKEGAEDTWNLPGGSLEEEESIRECAERELLEETGIEAEAEELLGVYMMESEAYGETVSVNVLECEKTGGDFSPRKEDSAKEVNTFTLEDLDEIDLRDEGLRRVAEDHYKKFSAPAQHVADLR